MRSFAVRFFDSLHKNANAQYPNHTFTTIQALKLVMKSYIFRDINTTHCGKIVRKNENKILILAIFAVVISIKYIINIDTSLVTLSIHQVS